MSARSSSTERDAAVIVRRPGPTLLATAIMAAAVMASVSPLQAQSAPQPAPQPQASMVVVLDGSNSMNARLANDRALKFVTVRDALRATLTNVTPGTKVGLAAFGARRSSDCNDAELMVQPSPDTGAVSAALDRYQPRGFSPVSLALRTAAKALPSGPGKSSIVLVLDDLASCRSEDPCAVATDLKRQNQALTIHVVGLGLRPADAQVLTCVTRQTGGQLISVTDGAGVAPAIEQAVQLASLDRPLQPPASPPRQVSAAPRVAPSVRPASAVPSIDVTRPGLHLTARLGEGRPMLLLPVSWRVWRRGEPQPLFDTTGPAVNRQLPNGAYEVEVRSGLITTRQSFDITSQGPTPVTVNLNAALLTIAAPLAPGATTAGDTVLTLSDMSGAGDTRTPRGGPIWIKRTGTEDLVVPPGSYRVRATAGLSSAERVVAAGSGTVTEIDLTLASGRLVVQERAGPTVDAIGPSQLIVEADDPDTTAGRRELYRAAASQLDLTLPSGAYVVVLRRGAIEARERVLIRPGETATRAIALPFGRVRLSSRIGSGLPAGLAVRYRIERLDPPAPPQQHWGTSEHTIDLSPGRYRFEARIGSQNAIVLRESDIKPGLEYRIELDPGAGGIQLKLAAAAIGLGFGDVYWQVFDDQGAAVWRTGQSDPILALGAGRYRARAEVRERMYERAFEVRSGDSRVVEVGE